jgi:hypothetical protein
MATWAAWNVTTAGTQVRPLTDNDYAAVIEEGENIPKDVAMPREGRRWQASTQNDHLEVTDEYFKVEVREFGSDEIHRINVIRDDDSGDWPGRG